MPGSARSGRSTGPPSTIRGPRSRPKGARRYTRTFTAGPAWPARSLTACAARSSRGDTIVVTKMDRFARTETEAYDQVLGWVQNGVKVRVLNMGTIEDTEIGRLILHIMLSFAEFERDMIVSRCQGGRAYKRATDPDYREGRKPGYSKAQLDHAVDLLHDHSFSEVAAMTGMSRSTVTREARKRGFRKSEL